MKKQRTAWFLLPALGLLVAAGTLWAFQGPPGTGDERPGSQRARMFAGHQGGMMEDLGLTDEQQEKLRSLHNQGRKAGIRSRADAEIKRMELEELLEADEPNQVAIEKAIRELNDLRGVALKRHIDQRLAFRGLLTPEQRSTFKKLHRERGMMFRHQMRQRFMDGPGGERRGRRGPGSVRNPGMGGPDFDIEVEEEMELEDTAPQE